MLSLFNRYYLNRVICNQFRSFCDYGGTKPNKFAVALHFGLPLIGAYLLVKHFGVAGFNKLDLITVYSIFVGLLFNLLVLIYGIFEKKPLNRNQTPAEKEVINNLFYNVMFGILICISSIVLVLIHRMVSEKELCFSWNMSLTYDLCLNATLIFLIYYFLLLFILDLLQILRRFMALIEPSKK